MSTPAEEKIAFATLQEDLRLRCMDRLVKDKQKYFSGEYYQSMNLFHELDARERLVFLYQILGYRYDFESR